jgi:glutamyl-tRNA synthetase
MTKSKFKKATKVRTRVAPSPTGDPHIGNFYSALLDFALAKKYDGHFVVRIEDTDRARFVEGAEKKFYEALDWLGLGEDESPRKGGSFGPYRQSERLETYQKYAQKLVDVGAAYKDQGAIRQKIPKAGETSFDDLIRGRIVFKNQNLDESVLLKSDGYPTYHLAVVVDDHLMQISHVIRGEDWIPSTPKHILLYRALGWEPPLFIHTPLLRNPDHSKLSKRKNPTSMLWYRDQGFLPEAIVNYLTHLGWTHPKEKEIYSFDEFLGLFEIEDIKSSAPVFDLEKLRWMNGKYLRSLSVSELKEKIKKQNSKLEEVDDDYLTKIIPLVQERLKTLNEFEELTKFFFEEPCVDSKLIVQKGKSVQETASIIKSINNQLSTISNSSWNAESLEQICRDFVKDNPNWTTKDLFMTLRIALTGETATPPLFETMEVLGRENSLHRLQNAAAVLQ